MPEASYQEEILNRSWNEIPVPKLLPVGSYLLKGRNASYVNGKDEQSPKALFFYVPKEAMDDVDGAALDELGADYDFNANQIVYTMWLETPQNWDAMRQHLAKHGITTEDRSLKETLKDFKGTEVIAYLNTRNFQNRAGETVTENNPTAFVKVE